MENNQAEKIRIQELTEQIHKLIDKRAALKKEKRFKIQQIIENQRFLNEALKERYILNERLIKAQEVKI